MIIIIVIIQILVFLEYIFYWISLASVPNPPETTKGFGRFAPAVDADDNKEDEEEEEELISEESNEFISSSELRRNRISSKGSFTLNCYRISSNKGNFISLCLPATFLCKNNILFLFLYIKCYFCTSDVIPSNFAKCCCGKRLYKIMWSTMVEEVKIVDNSMTFLANRVGG